MASSTPIIMVYVLLVACLMGPQLTSSRRVGEGRVAPKDQAKSLSSSKLVHLLKLSIGDIYARNAQMLRREYERSIAVIDSALSGDKGPVKRSATPPGSTSLGSGALYFLAREVELDQESVAYDENVELNEKLFDIAGK